MGLLLFLGTNRGGSAERFEDFDYETNSEGAIITQYHGSYTENVRVPEEINGVPVISVANTFRYRNVKSVTLPSSLKTIGDGAFRECFYLTNVSVPATVSFVGTNAFVNCTNLRNVFINGNTELREEAFRGCSSLRRVFFSYTGTNEIFWGSSVFSGCSKLAEIVIPTQVRNLNSGLLSGCSSLTNVDFRGPLRSIGGDAFGNCVSLTNLVFSNAVDFVGDGFRGSGITNLVFKKPIQSKEIFSRMPVLRTVVFEQDVGDSPGGFEDCPQLQSVVFAGRGEIGSVGPVLLTNCPSLTSISFAGKVRNLAGMGDCPSLTSVNFYGGLENIGAFAFKGCPQLKVLVLPNDLKFIGDQAFLNCTGLEKLIFLGQVRPTLDAYPFRGCSANLQINHPQGAADWASFQNWYGFGASAFSTNISVIWPTAEPIQIGQKLSEVNLTNGSARFAGTSESVAGTFSFDEPDFQPPQGNFTTNVVFTPELWHLGEQTNTITLRVLTNKPVVIAETLTVTNGWQFQYQVRTSNDPSIYSLAGNPPSDRFTNFQLSTDQGLIQAIPTKVGATSLIIRAANSEGSAGQASLVFNVVRGAPLVFEKPTARAIRFGQSLALSAILNGKASNHLGPVDGKFSWLIPDRRPPAGTTLQDVRFTPADLAGYRPTNISLPIQVLGITNHPGLLTLTNGVAPAEGLAIQVNFTATRYEVFGLPPGLKLDAKTGRISGRPALPANSATKIYSATLVAWRGEAERYSLTKTIVVLPRTALAYLDQVFSMFRPLSNKP